MPAEHDVGQPLERHLGLLQAVALNVTMIVGAGVFITVPLMLQKLPGPYALLGWLAAGVLILLDGLIWAELGATFPGSGGSYRYLLESYGPRTWGRLFAFLFIWQFLLSGPLELASGLIALDQFSHSLHPAWQEFNNAHTLTVTLWESQKLSITLSPGRVIAALIGLGIIVLLYRNLRPLGRITVVLWGGVLALLAWVLIAGWTHFDPARAFDFSGDAASFPSNFANGLAGAMALALYAYLGYYQVCYMGDEVRDPGRTLPRAVLLSALTVVVLFSLTHLAFLGVVSWHDVPTDEKLLDDYNLPAEFAKKLYTEWWVVPLVSLALMLSCFGSAFAGMLSYSRIPYGAARAGHFFGRLAEVHPTRRFPHVSLLFVGLSTLVWTFFDLGNVINALITTRILEQFAAQIIGLMVLRQMQPDLPRPFRVWLYPLPCGLALAVWLYVYVFSDVLYIVLGLTTLFAGVLAFLFWARAEGRWPFAPGSAT
jgi:amino acid transporter